MAKKESKELGKRQAYSIQADKVERKLRNCPRCGPGVFLAKHSNRESCGKCGYTEFVKK